MGRGCKDLPLVTPTSDAALRSTKDAASPLTALKALRESGCCSLPNLGKAEAVSGGGGRGEVVIPAALPSSHAVSILLRV